MKKYERDVIRQHHPKAHSNDDEGRHFNIIVSGSAPPIFIQDPKRCMRLTRLGRISIQSQLKPSSKKKNNCNRNGHTRRTRPSGSILLSMGSSIPTDGATQSAVSLGDLGQHPQSEISIAKTIVNKFVTFSSGASSLDCSQQRTSHQTTGSWATFF